MLDYIRAMGKHLGSSAADVLFVSAISLAPLLLGRLVLVVDESRKFEGSYWDFLSNGQLAFYSMGSLATILLICYRKKLPEQVGLFFVLLATFALLFLMILVGIDPTLNAKSFSFVGWAALILYIAVQIVRILVEAMRRVDAPDALAAGQATDNKTVEGLAARMGGRSHE
jgi:amino acid transporter